MEVIVSVAVLTTAIVFISRSFTSVVASTRLCQDIARACFLSEKKFWDIAYVQRKAGKPLEDDEGTEGKFRWSYTAKPLADFNSLVTLHLRLAWKDKDKEAEYPLDLYTYLTK